MSPANASLKIFTKHYSFHFTDMKAEVDKKEVTCPSRNVST